MAPTPGARLAPTPGARPRCYCRSRCTRSLSSVRRVRRLTGSGWCVVEAVAGHRRLEPAPTAGANDLVGALPTAAPASWRPASGCGCVEPLQQRAPLRPPFAGSCRCGRCLSGCRRCVAVKAYACGTAHSALTSCASWREWHPVSRSLRRTFATRRRSAPPSAAAPTQATRRAPWTRRTLCMNWGKTHKGVPLLTGPISTRKGCQ